MNERIKQLAYEAGLGKVGDFYNFDIERFAELIIKECMLAVYDDGQDAEYYQNRIAKRFGVENE